ncbi:hypothetical protein [Lutimonas sp.]|uniref:hypothetical protein n=1 Tax=Lutimonas sp. TaxID=1872403 RepID=UPI003D9AB9AA
MKNQKRYYLSILCAFLFTGIIYAQDQIGVTLRCDVAALNEGEDPATACRFVDQDPSMTTKEYTTYAEVGDTIIWKGESTDGSAAIDIKKIKYERGTNVFNKTDLDGTTTVVGSIVKKTNGKDYTYTISFKINNTGKMHSIDPKIRVGGD